MTKAQKEFIGKKFGRLTVISLNEEKIKEEKGKNNKTRIYYNCLCDCGNTTIVEKGRLKNGNTKSCGCFHHEVVSKMFITHGDSRNGKNKRLYSIYKNMKNRCYNKNGQDYNYYGGKGVIICDEWINDYMNFKNWALKNGYSDNLTIDRINVNGNYEPSNCRWVDMKTQMNNTTQNHMITYNGEIKTMAEWSEILDIPYGVIKNAINKRKMSLDSFIKNYKPRYNARKDIN